MLWLLLTANRRTALLPTETSILDFRVLPNDLDLNLHVNNGRYASLMDIGRADIILRSGLFKVLRTNKWYPVAAAVQLSFFRPLNLWQSYRLETRLLGWDDRWFIFEQRFMREGKCCCRAYVKTQIRKGRNLVLPEDVMEQIGQPMKSPEIDPEIMQQLEWIKCSN